MLIESVPNVSEGRRPDVVDRGGPQWHERDDVDRADARVLAFMDVHVDVVDRGGDEALQGVGDGVVLTGQR